LSLLNEEIGEYEENAQYQQQAIDKLKAELQATKDAKQKAE
jgi:hypothetical protein